VRSAFLWHASEFRYLTLGPTYESVALNSFYPFDGHLSETIGGRVSVHQPLVMVRSVCHIFVLSATYAPPLPPLFSSFPPVGTTCLNFFAASGQNHPLLPPIALLLEHNADLKDSFFCCYRAFAVSSGPSSCESQCAVPLLYH